jgi:hypothetical protein
VVGRRTGGDSDTLVVIEGIGAYGAKAASAAAEAGYAVAEPGPVAPALRRGAGKSDELDAELIAKSVLGVAAALLRWPRRDEGSGRRCVSWWSPARSSTANAPGPSTP